MKSIQLQIKNNFYLFFLAIFLIFYSINIFEYQRMFTLHPWITGDWLINYTNGFVRRGLLGEVATTLSSKFNASILNLVLLIKFSAYLVWTAFFFLIALKKRIGLFEMTLILAPWAFLFDLHDPLSSGRKELLLFCVFTVFIYLLIIKTKKDTKPLANWAFYYLLIALPLLTIIHEGLFFYFQFFLIPLLFIGGGDKPLVTFGIPYLISLIILLILYIFFKGDISYAISICNSLLEQNIPQSICDGAINALNPKTMYFTSFFFKTYIPLFLLTTIPLFFYTKIFSTIPLQKIIIIFLICLLPTLPLYYLAFDWGRWIYIGGILTLTTSIALKDKFYSSKLRDIVFLPLCVIYIFCWVLPHSVVGYTSFKWFNFPLAELQQLNFSSLWMFISF